MILVTGGTGFIGSRLVKEMLAQGYEVACVCRNNSDFSRVDMVYDQIKWVGNLESDIESAFQENDIEGVIHCATTYGRKGDEFFPVMEANVIFPLMLLKKACVHKAKFFINTDSFFTRELEGAWKVNQKVYMDLYTKTKYIFRESVRDNIGNIDVAFVNMELQHIYGGNDATGKFVEFLTHSLKNNVAEVELTEGLQGRDWTYVDDVVSAYITVLKKSKDFEPYHFYEFEVGTGKETTLRDFCLKMKEQSGAKTELAFGKRTMNTKELLHSVADNVELVKLGWKPQVDIDEGIRRILKDADCISCNTNL